MALLVAITLSQQFSFSKPADAKKTGKSCLFCHTKYGSKELTKAGKYYKEKGTLDGFEEKSEKAELFSNPELTTRPAALRPGRKSSFTARECNLPSQMRL